MLSFRRITRQGSSRRMDSGRAQAGVDGGELTSPRARTNRTEQGKPTLAAVMASHAKLERRVAEQEAEPRHADEHRLVAVQAALTIVWERHALGPRLAANDAHTSGGARA